MLREKRQTCCLNWLDLGSEWVPSIVPQGQRSVSIASDDWHNPMKRLKPVD